MRHTTVRRLTMILLLLGLLVAPARALAQETRLAITPGVGPPGTQFVIVVTGLVENEDYSIAVYRLDDQALIGVAEFTADAGGSIVVTYDSTGDQPGRYEAVVT